MDSGVIGWVIIIFIVVGLPIYFDHRHKMAKLMSKNAPDEKLLARIDALEKKCESLQEQVTEAHALLVDERRMMDQKLAHKLAEGSATIPDEAARQKSQTPVRTMM